MRKFTVLSKGFSEFDLFDKHQRKLGSLSYKKWFSFDSIINTISDSFEVKMEGFWKSKMVLYGKDNRAKVTVKYSWNGFIFEQDNHETLFLQWKGFLGSKIVLLDHNKSEILTTVSIFDWKKFTSNYEITFDESRKFSPEFILLVVHCINYQMMVAST